MGSSHDPAFTVRGRAAAGNPKNRFERLDVELEAPPPDREATLVLRDTSRSIVSRNQSPDVPFDVSLNPYRGCEHGCIYCYARPTHEYLGFSAGLDFETRILAKEDAPELLRRALTAKSWTPSTLAMSGVTDPYQPVEASLGITRRCLEVLAELRHPVGVITKSALVARDVDLLGALAAHDAASVALSITSLDPEVARRMEPRAASPRRRLEAIGMLAEAGVPVGVMVAPIVPGLTDHEMPAILEAAAEAGASFAAFTVLRLPGAVEGLFDDWLERHHPARRQKVMSRLRTLRGGAVHDARFGHRMHGWGVFADQIAGLFHAARRKHGLARRGAALSTAAFRKPGEQTRLF
ncbi:MAG: PA0069 family radical SAM protein [Acidobacteriota bacterium]